MPHLDVQAKYCPLCKRPLTRIWQLVTIFGRGVYDAHKRSTFRRHLMACLICGKVVRLNRLPKRYDRTLTRRKR